VLIVSTLLETLVVNAGAVKSRSTMSNVGRSRKPPVVEYSIRITSGVSTSKRASPSTIVALATALPFARLIALERFTGELSEVAACAAAGPIGRSRAAAVAAAVSAPRAGRGPEREDQA